MSDDVIRIEELHKVYHVGEVDLHVLKGVIFGVDFLNSRRHFD